MSNLTHLQRIRQEMPATTSHIYLNTGTFGPLAGCVVEAMQERVQDEWRNGRLGAEAFDKLFAIYNDARSRVAQLLNADPGEIALTDNTSEGLNIISYGFNWQEGDEVITTNHEHIGALGPLYQIRDRYGIVIRIADLGPQADRPASDVISELITPRTRLIVLSHVTWSTGAVLDIRSVACIAHERGLPVLIDGAQSAGAIPVDVKALEIDFYAIPMQKWLCGPDGTGALYVRQESLHYAIPTNVGYGSVKHEEEEWVLHDTAKRFEFGGYQTAALAGQCATLKWLEEVVGHQWLFEHISQLHSYAYIKLKDIPGISILTPVPGASGLLAFKFAGHDSNEVVKYLQTSHNIYIRSIPETQALRISTGFYNTEEEIDTLVQALAQL
ncbi:MAG TPA: aminotransferase class V-fold PLP-dependent enzyme [Ktedonobacteraceae bacterium]|nr:aminotransferase class V-fold PLP-dependent enzyme [Ktedonobacteraceae bacterium]